MSRTIVLADDDALLTTVLKLRLESHGYQVRVFGDGRQALDMIRARPPRVAILDYYMPGLDGGSVCAGIRRLGLPVRVIMLTSASAVQARVRGLDAGADDYVCKPFEMDELLARVRVQMRHSAHSAGAGCAAQQLLEDLGALDAAIRAEAVEAIRLRGTSLHFRVLGDFRIMWEDCDLSALLWNRRKPRILLKLLVLQYGRVVSSDVLEEALWADAAPVPGRHRLHVAIQRLRRGLVPFGDERIVTEEGGYRFEPAPGDRLDLREFASIVRTIERKTASGGAGAALLAGIPHLCDLYAGNVLADEPYAEWVEPVRASVRSTFLGLLAQGAREHLAAGRAVDAGVLLRRLTDLEPTHEEYAVALAECLLDQGDRAGAGQVLESLKRILKEELDVSPGPRYRQVLARLRAVKGGGG